MLFVKSPAMAGYPRAQLSAQTGGPRFFRPLFQGWRVMGRSARRLSWVAFVATSVVLPGCGTGGPAYGPPSPGVAASVDMTTGFAFEPGTVRVKTGDTVEWRNKSLFAHTVLDDPQRDPALTALPLGAAPFDSGRVPAGEVFRHTFAVPGTYRYKCTPHDDLGMTGVVIVEPRG